MQNADCFIFIPAYNVQNSLKSVLEQIPENIWLRSNVLVIDDCSCDNTYKAYQEFVSQINEFKVARLSYIKLSKNSGYGAVVKLGIFKGLKAKANYIACLHGDAQYPANKLGKLFNVLDKASLDKLNVALVQGSRRLLAGGAVKGHMPLYKRIGGSFLTKLENAIFSQKLTDRHSGFIAYSAKFLKTIDIKNLSKSFDIDMQLICLADYCKYKIFEVPIPTRYAGEKSNLNVVTYGCRILKILLQKIFRCGIFSKAILK